MHIKTVSRDETSLRFSRIGVFFCWTITLPRCADSTLLAGVVSSGLLAAAARARTRGADLMADIHPAGPSAMAIVSIVNFLIGAILAFVGAVQLRRSVADIYVADLAGLALVREMTACSSTLLPYKIAVPPIT